MIYIHASGAFPTIILKFHSSINSLDFEKNKSITNCQPKNDFKKLYNSFKTMFTHIEIVYQSHFTISSVYIFKNEYYIFNEIVKTLFVTKIK